jgi:hypothetical protein
VREPILHLFPQSGALQRAMHDFVELHAITGEAMDARTVRNVFINRLGERIRLLEHHADAGTQLHHVLLPVVNVLAVEQD